MSCLVCDDHPVTTYVRVGNANVEIKGCRKHLSMLIDNIRLDVNKLVKFVFDRYAAGSMPTDQQIEYAIQDFVDGAN